MRTLAIAVTAAISIGASTATAQQYGPQPNAAAQRELLALREAVWRAWFANDRTGFERIVPDELVALGWDGGEWSDRRRTVEQMAEFAKTNTKLTTLDFGRNVFQRYGDVVILYSTFHLVLTDRAGASQETTGRGTEVFVRRGGRWIHTGWHLDTVAN